MQYDTDIYADRIGYALYYYRKEEEVSQGRLLRRREREEMVVGPSLLLLSLFVLCRKEGGSDVTVGALSLLSIWMVLLCLCMEGGRMDVKTKDESREEGGEKGRFDEDDDGRREGEGTQRETDIGGRSLLLSLSFCQVDPCRRKGRMRKKKKKGCCRVSERERERERDDWQEVK